jgi:hypothetical protein
MAKKCRKCRQKKRNMDTCPKRPPRGSMRAAKRKKMRENKMKNLEARKAQEEAQC